MVVGVNPRDGYFEGQRFLHPELAFEMTFPAGWATVNQKTLVGAQPASEDAVVLLTVEQEATDPATALSTFLAAEGISGGPGTTTTSGSITIHRSEFEAAVEQGTVSGEIAYLSFGGLYLGSGGGWGVWVRERGVLHWHGSSGTRAHRAVAGELRP